MSMFLEFLQVVFALLTVSGVLPAIAITLVETYDFSWVAFLVFGAAFALLVYSLLIDTLLSIPSSSDDVRVSR